MISAMGERDAEDLLRALAPEVLGALVRRYGHFDLSEDAVQESLLAAARQWPVQGVPDNPRGWLITVASRRLVDLLRSEQARREREQSAAQWTLDLTATAPADEPGPVADDTLVLLFMCCHPTLSAASQIALTLRAVAGLTTAEIARAFLVSEETMARRISRAKQTVQSSRTPFRVPRAEERPQRLQTVLHTLYLIFNEGYVASSGASLQRAELVTEAIRLASLVHRLMPHDSEAAGLLALMLLTDARRPARVGATGELIPIAEQDRQLWDRRLIATGMSLLTAAMARGPVGHYQLQAAIAALHDQATDVQSTDWPQIVALYDALLTLGDNPIVHLNRAVAVAMAHGPAPALRSLEQIENDSRLAGDHRLPAVRGHLLEMLGDLGAARDAYLTAAARATSVPQQRYLNAKATRIHAGTRVRRI
jgi:RNA polymerase sigma factor (sigma-70 family)